MQSLPPEALVQVASYFQALAEPTRLQLLNLLREQERNVGELAELTGYSAANISRHLALLTRVEKLPTLDAATHTVQVRADLPAGLQGVAPGGFARLWLPVAAGREPGVWVPMAAVLRRAELTALYVQGADGKPLLRQVRLGRSDGERIEVLAGVAAGERVLTDPQAAARSR